MWWYPRRWEALWCGIVPSAEFEQQSISGRCRRAGMWWLSLERVYRVQSTDIWKVNCDNSSCAPVCVRRIASVVVAVVRLYQRTISEVTPHRCRFQPTCSEYTAEAVERYGLLCGMSLGARRMLRCHPFSESRYDPVPPLGDELTERMRITN